MSRHFSAADEVVCSAPGDGDALPLWIGKVGLPVGGEADGVLDEHAVNSTAAALTADAAAHDRQ